MNYLCLEFLPIHFSKILSFNSDTNNYCFVLCIIQDVYRWICSSMDPSYLPLQFHLRCMPCNKGQDDHGPHCPLTFKLTDPIRFVCEMPHKLEVYHESDNLDGSITCLDEVFL